jgi:hypothetical protein
MAGQIRAMLHLKDKHSDVLDENLRKASDDLECQEQVCADFWAKPANTKPKSGK